MPEYNFHNFLILAVDDNSINRIVLEKVLTKVGYQVKVLPSSEECLQFTKVVTPDLILLDLMMPEIDGLQLCKLIKSDPQYEETPIIFLTASDEKKNVIQAFQAGAVDYVTKPFNGEELLARIKTHLELKYTRDRLKKALVEVEKLATLDELTGISNRRNFLKLAHREFKLACRQKRIFSIIILDIDFFKKINDTYGHPLGDVVIKLVAEECNKCLRDEDLCARWGGEEFIIFLTETKIEDAKLVGERIRQKIRCLSLPVDDPNLFITVSIGIAEYNSDDVNVNYIISRADRALYRSKNNGRNQVTLENELLYLDC